VRESQSLVLHAPDVDALRAIGAAIAQGIRNTTAPLVISLAGELGAGKTTLVGGLLNALGFAGYVRSPTYTLIEPYELAGRSIYHLDLYRLVDAREVEALGLRDLLEPLAVLLIEWPERGGGALPPFDLSIGLQYASQSGRDLTFFAGSKQGREVLAAFEGVTKP
jgi:tRNA threonylcarbamoyladenosine biosynthesis protein TsaE